MEISGDSTLKLRSGKIVYNNYNESNKIIFDNNASSLRIESINGLYAKRNLSISNGTLKFPFGDYLGIADGKTLFQNNMTHIHDSPFTIHRLKSNMKKGTVEGSATTLQYYLNNNDFFYSLEGSSGVPIIAESGTSKIGGPGLINAIIQFNSSSATLRQSLSTQLQNNIRLNGGSLILDNDLNFISDKKITGTGKINLNNHKLSFGTGQLTFSDPIYWTASSGIDLNAKTSLTNSWTFNGICNINGHGNVLELGSQGKIAIRPNSTIYLTDIALKNLGTGNNGFVFFDNTSSLHMSNVYVELDNNYSTTIGGIYVEGPTTFGLKNYNWTFDNRGSLTVDSTTLWKDGLSIVNNGKIKFGTGNLSQYLSLTNSGTIKLAANLDILTTDTSSLQTQIKNNSNAIIKNTVDIRVNSNAIIYFQTSNLDVINGNIRANSRLAVANSNAINYYAPIIRSSSYYNSLIRQNSNAINYYAPIIRSNSYYIRVTSNYLNYAVKIYNSNYSASDGQTLDNLSMFKSGFTIPAAGTVTIQTGIPVAGIITIDANGTMALAQDLDLLSNAQINIGSSAGDKAYIAGNNHTLFIDSYLDLPANRFLEFSSNTTLDFLGGDLIFNTDSRINVADGKFLTLKDVVIRGLTDKSINMLGQNSRLVLQNALIELAGNYIFTNGALDIKDLVSFSGHDYAFTYSSDQNLTIYQDSTLHFDIGTTFTYQKATAPTNDAERQKIIMQNYSKTACLHFNGSTFHIPINTGNSYDGLRLLGGTLIIENKVLFDNATQADNPNDNTQRAISIGNGTADGNNTKDVNVKLLSGARLEAIGYIDYDNYDNN